MSRVSLSPISPRHERDAARAGARRDRNQTYHQARRAARVDRVVGDAQRDRARLAAQRAATWNRMRRCTPMGVGSWSRLERELGMRLTPTARDVLGLVRRAVQRGNSGAQLTVEQVAHKLGRCTKSIERALRLLERVELVVRVPQFEPAPGWSCRDGQARHQRQVASVLVLGPAGKEHASPARRCRRGRGDKLSPPKTSPCTSYKRDDRTSRGRRTGTAKPIGELVAHRPEGKEPAPVSPASSRRPAAAATAPRDRVTPASSPEAPEEGERRDALADWVGLCPGLSAALALSEGSGGGAPPCAPAAACAAVERDSVTVTGHGHGHGHGEVTP
jgi:hypothetical protein